MDATATRPPARRQPTVPRQGEATSGDGVPTGDEAAAGDDTAQHVRSRSDRVHAWRGVRSMLPLLAGVTPLALVIGARAAESDLGALAGWSTSWTIYSGSPQLLTFELLADGAPWLTVIVGVTLLNLRLVVYSAAVASRWRSAPLRWRLLVGATMVDPTFVVADGYSKHAPDLRAFRVHHVAAALTLWVGWLVATAAGLVVGDHLTALVPAEVVLELLLLSLVVPKLQDRRSLVSAAVVAGVALPALLLPAGLGMLVAAACGVAVLLVAPGPTGASGVSGAGEVGDRAEDER